MIAERKNARTQLALYFYGIRNGNATFLLLRQSEPIIIRPRPGDATLMIHNVQSTICDTFTTTTIQRIISTHTQTHDIKKTTDHYTQPTHTHNSDFKAVVQTNTNHIWFSTTRTIECGFGAGVYKWAVDDVGGGLYERKKNNAYRYSLLTWTLPAATNGQFASGTSAPWTRSAAMFGPVVCSACV